MRRRVLPVLLAAAVVLGVLALAPSATSVAPPPNDLVQLVRVDTPTRADRQRVADLGLDLSEHAGEGFVDVVLHGAQDVARLTDAGFGWTVQIPDLVAREAEIAALDAAYAAAADSKAMPSGRKAYRDLVDYEWDMKELAKRNPDLVKLIKLPHLTNEGRTVWALEITRDVAATDGKPVFAIMGIHHAREWPAGEHTMEFAFDLVKSFRANDSHITDLLGRARVLVIPVVNPDGFHASREGAAYVDGRELAAVEGGVAGDTLAYTAAQAAAFPAYKRKNCRMVEGQTTPTGSCTAPGARHLGVDPNRNYGALWGGAGASAVPADDIYRGPAPFSEPETQNVRDAISARPVTMLVTNHTFAGLVLRAPGVKDHGVTVDEPAMRDIGAAMADANGSANQAGYQLYDTTGTTEDWSYGTTGGFGYTFEIAVTEFHPPFEETVATYFGAGKTAGRGNREAFSIALATAADPIHHSVIAVDAPAGAVLRLHKEFETSTSPVRMAETQFTDDPGTAGDALTFEERLEIRTLSPGHLEWHVNPSTRPAVMERIVHDIEGEPGFTATHEGATPPPSEHVDVPFTLGPEDATELLEIDLDWAEPDDLDMEVFRKEGGELVPVGQSGNFPGEKEHLSIEDPVPGEYVVRVINYASVSTSFTITTATYAQGVTKIHKPLLPYETWTVSCERPDGTVLESVKVLVSRGDRVMFDLAECRSRWAA